MCNEACNGYTNYETWLVSLHLDNNKGTQDLLIELAKESIEEAQTEENFQRKVYTLMDAAKYILESKIEALVEDAKPEVEETFDDLFKGLLDAALDTVDYVDIAEGVLHDIFLETAQDLKVLLMQTRPKSKK